MKAHTCYHCQQWVEEGEVHDCWTTTEAALTADLTEDLREAWERLRETAAEFGEQRIYASHSSIMFSRRSCYFFVRPKRSFLEVNVFLGRTVQGPQVRKAIQSSAAKTVHVIQVRHRDEVEAPLTDWLEEAYHYVEEKRTRRSAGATAPKAKSAATPKAAGKAKAVGTSKAAGKVKLATRGKRARARAVAGKTATGTKRTRRA